MQLNNNLSANSASFIFDYHDGKYGFNTNPNRGADTFIPFKSEIKSFSSVQTGTNTITCSSDYGQCLLNLTMAAANYDKTTLNGNTIVPFITYINGESGGWNGHHYLYLVNLKAGDVINTVPGSLTQNRILTIYKINT